MNLVEWSKSSAGYGRKIVNSAIEGVRTGEGEFLKQERLIPFLGESAQHALKPAVMGACIGFLCGYLEDNRRSKAKMFAFSFLGGAIGFGAGVIWQSRQLTATVASSVRRSIRETRDEHWFEKNPIDYA